MSKIKVTTAPDEFVVPELWHGCVTRDGHTFPEPMEAKDWLPGDTVQTLIRLDGRLTQVRFVVGSLEAIEAGEE